MSDLTVTISGTAGAGKSTLAILLQDFLESRGLTVVVEDPEGCIPFLRSNITDNYVNNTPHCLTDGTITIREQNLLRRSRQVE